MISSIRENNSTCDGRMIKFEERWRVQYRNHGLSSLKDCPNNVIDYGIHSKWIIALTVSLDVHHTHISQCLFVSETTLITFQWNLSKCCSWRLQSSRRDTLLSKRISWSTCLWVFMKIWKSRMWLFSEMPWKTLKI